MTNKLAVSLKDPTTGVETNAQEITNAPNGDYVVVRGAQASVDPNGNEWTAETLTNVQHKLVAQTAQNTTTTVRSSGHTIEFWSSPIANNVFMAPSDNMEFSNDPNNPIENVIGWDYDDSLDQKEQTGWRVRIFPDFVVNSSGFDPSTNPYYAWSQSGTDDSNQVTITKSDGFISGERYWAYVQVSKKFHGQEWLGDWTAKPFTVIIEQPQPAIISVFTNTSNATNELIIQSTDNLFSDRNGDFGNAETGQASVGGWNVAAGDSAGTSIDVGATGGTLGATLVPGQTISVIPFGATGYIADASGITISQSTGTVFKVSGTNGSNASPLAFPITGQFWVTIDSEKILVTNKVDGTKKTDPDTFVIVSRGYNGTTPAAHSQWATVTYGTQDDIFIGSVGTLRWDETVTVIVKKAVPGRHAVGGHPMTVPSTHDYAVVSIPKGADNSKKKYLWVKDPHDSLRAHVGVATLTHATPKATNPTKKAKSVATEPHLTIDSVSNAPTIVKPQSILIGSTPTAIVGAAYGLQISSMPIKLAQTITGTPGAILPSGSLITVSWYDPINKKTVGCDLTLTQPLNLSVGTDGVLHFKTRGSFGALNKQGLWEIALGAKFHYWTSPRSNPNQLKKLTLSQALASYPAVGDVLSVVVSTTFTIGAKPKVPGQPAVTKKKTTNYEQDFLVAESVSTTPGNNSAVFPGSTLGHWDGSVFTPATGPFNAVQIINAPNGGEDVYVGFGIIGLGIPMGATITSVVPNNANNSVVLILDTTATPVYSGNNAGTPVSPIYTTTVTLNVPTSTVIPAGSQSIPVVPFIPKAKFPIGIPIKFSYPPYFGSNSLIVETTTAGTAEITIQDPNWTGWNPSNSVSTVPGVVYGFSAFGKLLSTSPGTTMNLYVDWFDALNNYLSTSDGSQSLANPAVNNTIVTPALGPDSGTMDWTPNAIAMISPKSATIVPVAYYYSHITGGGPLLATGTVGTATVMVNSMSGVTITTGTILTLGVGLNAEEVQVLMVSGTTLLLSQKLLYTHTNDLVSNGSAYSLASPLARDLTANTTLVMGSGATVVTSAAVSAGSNVIPVQFVNGAPITTADSIGISAAYACPRIELTNTTSSGKYAISAPCFKALTAHDPTTSYVSINSEIPALSRGVDVLSSAGPDSTFVIPEGTPTEGAGTIYIFDPTNDLGTRELHMGSGDTILDTTLKTAAQAGSRTINVVSAKGLARGQKIVLNLYASLPTNSQSVVNVESALYQAGLTATEQNAANAANNQMAANFTKTAGVVNDKTEALIIDPFWDGSHVITLEQPLKNSYPAGTQVCGFTTGSDTEFLLNQVQGTSVAVLNWNRSGYLNTPGAQYYFVVEYSNDYGKTWTTLYGGDNLSPDAHGQARITDFAVIPNSTTYYRATGNYIDKDKDKTVTAGAVSPPSLAPTFDSDVWWISSTSDQTLRFPMLVQNNVAETQKHTVGVFYPLGSTRPYTLAGAVQGRDATIQVVWTDASRWNDFITFLNRGETYLLLDPVEGERRYIFLSDDVTVTHHAAPNPYRTVAITYVEAAPPGFGYTYGSK